LVIGMSTAIHMDDKDLCKVTMPFAEYSTSQPL